MDQCFVLDEREILWFTPKKDQDGYLRLVVPKELQDDVLHSYHDELGAGGHQGIFKTFQKIKKFYYWPGMYKDVVQYVKSCTDCSSAKRAPDYAGISPGNIVATRPFQVLSMDYAVALPTTLNGNKNILVFVDNFTGFIILVPMRETTAEDTAEAYLEQVYRRFGGSEVLRHDRGTQFMSKMFKSFNRLLRQKQRATLAYRPQANGLAERTVQITMAITKMYINDELQRDWDQYLYRFELALNNAYHADYKNTSFYLVHGWDPRTTMDSMIPPMNKSKDEVYGWKWRKKIKRKHEMCIKAAEEVHKVVKKSRADKHNDALHERSANARMEYAAG